MTDKVDAVVAALMEWQYSNVSLDASLRKHGLLPAHAPAPPLRWPGVEVVQANDRQWDVRTDTHYLAIHRWADRHPNTDSRGCFETSDLAISALNDPRTPPPPHVAERSITHAEALSTLEAQMPANAPKPHVAEGKAEVWPRWFVSKNCSDHKNGTHRVWRMTSPTEGMYWRDGNDHDKSVFTVSYLIEGGHIELTEATCPTLAEARREWRERQGTPSTDITTITAERDRLAADVARLERDLSRCEEFEGRSQAWLAVCELMNRLVPRWWIGSTGTGVEKMCAAIEKLHANQSTALRAAKKPGRKKGAKKR